METVIIVERAFRMSVGGITGPHAVQNAICDSVFLQWAERGHNTFQILLLQALSGHLMAFRRVPDQRADQSEEYC